MPLSLVENSVIVGVVDFTGERIIRGGLEAVSPTAMKIEHDGTGFESNSKAIGPESNVTGLKYTVRTRCYVPETVRATATDTCSTSCQDDPKGWTSGATPGSSIRSTQMYVDE